MSDNLRIRNRFEKKRKIEFPISKIKQKLSENSSLHKELLSLFFSPFNFFSTVCGFVYPFTCRKEGQKIAAMARLAKFHGVKILSLGNRSVTLRCLIENKENKSGGRDRGTLLPITYKATARSNVPRTSGS